MDLNNNSLTQHENGAVWQEYQVTRLHREQRAKITNNHRGVVIWFTGLSGSGKSTIANRLEYRLHHEEKCLTMILDGDNIRHGLSGDLGFSVEDRMENMRRVGEVAKLFLDVGIITMTAFISPLRSERQKVKEMFSVQDFIEIYCHCPIEVCEKRDVKGLYQKARNGQIKQFTGIDSPYEEPSKGQATLVLNTAEYSLEQCVDTVIEYLYNKNIIEKKEI